MRSGWAGGGRGGTARGEGGDKAARLKEGSAAFFVMTEIGQISRLHKMTRMPPHHAGGRYPIPRDTREGWVAT